MALVDYATARVTKELLEESLLPIPGVLGVGVRLRSDTDAGVADVEVIGE